jgi:hypothetical protein
MTIDKKLLLYLFLTFILFTIIGTLSHEFGHYAIAKILGYDAHIHYAFTQWTSRNNQYSQSDSFYITLGGPLQTMLTGTFGLCLVYFNRKSFKKNIELTFGQWTLLFLSLFWLRQTANFVIWFSSFTMSGQFSNQPDEIRLAKYLEIPNWSITSFTALIGLIVLITIVFQFIPSPKRLTFIFSGLFGGLLGYIIWLHGVGQILIP